MLFSFVVFKHPSLHLFISTSAFPSIYLAKSLSVGPSVSPSVYWCVCLLAICPSINWLSVCLSVYWSICQTIICRSVYWSMYHLSVFPSIGPSIHLSVNQLVHLSTICLCVYWSICPSIHLSVCQSASEMSVYPLICSYICLADENVSNKTITFFQHFFPKILISSIYYHVTIWTLMVHGLAALLPFHPGLGIHKTHFRSLGLSPVI